MTVVHLNLGNYGSTGSIAAGINRAARAQLGWDTYLAYPESANCKPQDEHSIVIKSDLGWRMNRVIGRLTARNGMVGYFSTKRFLKKLKKLHPTVLHFHNLHNSYVHLPLLFRFIKKHDIRVVWTLHDCWAFTGHCPHFTMAACDKWKTQCHDCPSYKKYPESLFDDARRMHRLKKKWFSGVPHLTLVTPSHWLGRLVKQSFLRDYPLQVIHNGINLSVFRPTDSDFRAEYGIAPNKKILLGVAFGWGERKGLDVFIELARRLDPDEYQIVLVGTNELVDAQLPKTIISIHRTQNQQELAKIYTAADLFVNPTREEVLGLVNIEALACGTPVLTFKTGGSPECIDPTCGSVVDCDDVDALEAEIIRICKEKPYSAPACRTFASQFSQENRFEEYIQLYKGIQRQNNHD